MIASISRGEVRAAESDEVGTTAGGGRLVVEPAGGGDAGSQAGGGLPQLMKPMVIDASSFME
jgi:hypothetical protein